MPLSDILRGAPVKSVAEAIAVMRAIDHALPDADGVKWFNRPYLRVTERVEGALGGAGFEDPAFIATLDVAFANLYFSALQSGDAEQRRPPGVRCSARGTRAGSRASSSHSPA
jgi:hypothetical protein